MSNDMNVDITSQTITAQKGHVQALAFARKGGAALSALLAGAADAKQAETLGPIKMCLFLETNYTDDEAAAIPVVGSKKEDAGNKPYDRYNAEVTTKDGKKKVPGSWYTDVVKTTDEWALLNQEREWITGTETEGVPEKFIKMRKTSSASERLEEIKDRITWMRTALTRGSMLFHHVAEIAALNPERIKVKMPYRKDAETGEMMVYGSKIKLIDPTEEEETKVYSLGSFLALKPDAIVGAATLVSLDKTGSRPSRKGPPAGSAAYPVPKTIEALLTCFNITSTALDNGTDEGRKLEAALITACAKQGKEGDEVVLSVGSLCMAADNIWNVINNRYTTLMAQKAAAINTPAVKVA